jgi:hypothetical protein
MSIFPELFQWLPIVLGERLAISKVNWVGDKRKVLLSIGEFLTGGKSISKVAYLIWLCHLDLKVN